MNKLYLITGPAGVGKSTISYDLASSLEKSVVIEGDTIYNFFVGGRIKPWFEDAPLGLFWSNCIYLIKSYLENGYDVVFNYIINPQNLKKLKETFKEYDIVFKCLMTSEEELLKRDKEREEDCRMNERCLVLLNEFKSFKFNKNEYLDTSNLSIKEVSETIKNSFKN